MKTSVRPKLILNPVAGADSGPRHLPTINERLRTAVGPLDIQLTVGDGDAETLARAAALEGCEHLFVAGGDGTLNEVLNGVASVPDAFERITFGVIPLGTGNDFASALGIGDVATALNVVAAGRSRQVDVGLLNDRCFVNVSAGAFLAEVSVAANERLKNLAGRLAYLIGGAQVLLDYDPVGARVQVEDSRPLRLYAFAVCNSRLVGGGRLIAPDARIDDGQLDVCLIEAMSTVEFVALLTRVSSGEHVHDERVLYFRTPEIGFTFERSIKVNTDGQVLEADRCDYRVLPGAIRFLAPA